MLAGLFSVLALVSISIVAAPSPAVAQSGYVVQFENSRIRGMCIDHNSRNNVHMRGCNDAGWQYWIPQQGALSGYVTFKNQKTGVCLDYSPSRGLRGVRCYYNSYQSWGQVYHQSSNTSTWVHMQTGRCLDYSRSYGLRVIRCNQGSYQKWSMF